MSESSGPSGSSGLMVWKDPSGSSSLSGVSGLSGSSGPTVRKGPSWSSDPSGSLGPSSSLCPSGSCVPLHLFSFSYNQQSQRNPKKNCKTHNSPFLTFSLCNVLRGRKYGSFSLTIDEISLKVLNFISLKYFRKL